MVVKNKIRTVLLWCIFLLLLNACKAGYYLNKCNSPRPVKENAFSYAKKNFRLYDTLLIDTASIYLLVDTTSIFYDKTRQATCFIRFFNTGNFFFNIEKIDNILEYVNDFECGMIGYYYITKNNFLKMQYFATTDGGKTHTYFGLFDNGDLLIYDTPAMVWSSVWLWELLEGHTKKRWKKIKIDGLKPVVPDW